MIVIQSLAEAKESYDYIVFAHKALISSSVPKNLADIVTPQTTIVLLQNGVGNEDGFRELLPDVTILTCAVRTFTLLTRVKLT
jgi:ketopantoate reductase